MLEKTPRNVRTKARLLEKNCHRSKEGIFSFKDRGGYKMRPGAREVRKVKKKTRKGGTSNSRMSVRNQCERNTMKRKE